MGTSSSGDISMNFAKNLVEAFGLVKRRRSKSTAPSDWLNASMFGDARPALSKNAGGQFSPGGWGPNASVGFDGDSLINPWDFVFMVEGILAFAGAPVRKLSPESRSKAVFPFTVDASAAGYSTPTSSEYASTRAEFWVPLWDRPSTLEELLHVATEGRSQLGRRQASNGAGFARAIAGLGTERGIASFQRFGLLQRTGIDGVIAAPIGRLAVKVQTEANVLFDLDSWLDRLRRYVRGAKAPAGLGVALSQIESAIIEFCQRGWPRDLQNVLIAVGCAERWLSKSGLRENMRPLNSLSQSWLRHSNDQSAEFRLARAIASILYEPEPAKGQHKIGPIRENLEPVDTYPRVEWKDDSTSFVWTAGNPVSNMLAVLQRRVLEGRTQGTDHLPLDSAHSARLLDIAAFLGGGVDVQRMADLVLPLSFVRYRHRKEESDSERRSTFRAPFDLPAAYAAMKLTLLPGKFECPAFDADTDISTEPVMLAMLRAGRVGDAYKVACRRLRASGLTPLSDDPGIRDRSEQSRRLAAALLFPLDESAYCALAKRALRRPDRLEEKLSLVEQTAEQ